jgi:cytochrome oxidase assembly protein ShyY1
VSGGPHGCGRGDLATVESVRFLLSRRWLLFAVAVALLAYGCWWLGEWQFHRLDERRTSNAHISRNLELAPAPVDDVLAVGEDVRPDEYWRRVRATGRYLADAQVAVRYQTRDGQPGVDVVTPLRVEDTGTLLVVDRGWMPTDNAAEATPPLPEPPSGTVTVVGWVRPDGTGDSTTVASGSTRAVSSDAIAATLEAPVFDGWVDLAAQRPVSDQSLERTELPDLSEGPHFFYGLQWWFFALLAVFGFGYLAFDERRKRVNSEAPSAVVTGSEASRRPPAASRR